MLPIFLIGRSRSRYQKSAVRIIFSILFYENLPDIILDAFEVFRRLLRVSGFFFFLIKGFSYFFRKFPNEQSTYNNLFKSLLTISLRFLRISARVARINIIFWKRRYSNTNFFSYLFLRRNSFTIYQIQKVTKKKKNKVNEDAYYTRVYTTTR